MNGILLDLLSKNPDIEPAGESLLSIFLSAAARLESDANAIGGADLAKLLNILADAEIREGGPYRSFINSPNNDVDAATNAAIAYFLSLQNVNLPELDNLIKITIDQKKFDSKFFASEYPVVYLLARVCDKSRKHIITGHLLGCLCRNGTDQALAEASLDFIIGKNEKKPAAYNEGEKHAIDMIMDLAKQRFSSLGADLQKIAFLEIKKTMAQNPDNQMSLIAYYTKLALGKKGEKIPDKIIAQMGLANIFFWTAFIIYDNFWDCDEEASPHILPIANLFARHYTDFFDSMFSEQTGFKKMFHCLMDKLDDANTWETLHCRAAVAGNKFIIPEILPDYTDYESKYRPSSGHILGPVALLYRIGYGGNSGAVRNLTEYFKNYLIAMQINDDAHDWVEDMQRGHLSTVVNMLLQDWLTDYPGQKEIDLLADMEKLQRLFWFKTIKRASQVVIDYAQKSRLALRSLTILENPAPLEKYIILNENVANKALIEQAKSVDFIREMEVSGN